MLISIILTNFHKIDKKNSLKQIRHHFVFHLRVFDRNRSLNVLEYQWSYKLDDGEK